MKKFMVADLVKDLREESILEAMSRFGMNRANATIFVDNFPNKATWDDVEATAEALNISIEDVTDDDVEEYLSTGGADEIDTSIGNAVFKWDNVAKAYILYLALDPGLTSKCDGRQVYKNISRDMIQEMRSADSFGSFYNDKLRGNTSIEGCGCADNCCDDADFAEMPSKFRPLF